jgi:hypothetical protein
MQGLPAASSTNAEEVARAARVDDIHDELAAVSLPTYDFPWEAAAAGVVLLLALVAAIVWYRRRRRPKAVETLEAEARGRLAALAAMRMQDARSFHNELAAILVRYVEARLALRSTRLTSGEIVREFRRNGVMSGEWQAMLEEFFADCDRAKFAPAARDWDGADALAALARCRLIIDGLAAQAAASSTLASPWEGWKNAAV